MLLGYTSRLHVMSLYNNERRTAKPGWGCQTCDPLITSKVLWRDGYMPINLLHMWLIV